MLKCPECNAAVPYGEEKCPHCDFLLLSGNKSTPRKPRGGKLLVVLATVLFLLLAGAGAYKAVRYSQLEKHLSHGADYLTAGQHQQALESFTRALEIDDDNIRARLGVARSLLASGNHQQAESVLQDLIEHNPSLLEGYELLCAVRIEAGDIAGALQCIESCQQAVGRDALKGLRQQLEAGISILAEKEEYILGEWAELQLLYSTQDHRFFLTPQWIVPEPGQADIQSDGSAKVTMAAPGQIKVTADLGPISREIVLTFTKDEVRQAAQLVENFNHYFLVPPFSSPNDIPNDSLLELVIIWLVKYSGEEKYVFTAAEVEEAAKGLFGPDLRDLKHQELGFVWWDAAREEYEIIPLGLGSWVKTFIIDTKTAGGQYMIDAVHLRVVIDYEGEEREVYDENGNLLGEFSYDELEAFTRETLLKLPRRRHILTILDDGSFHMVQSLKLQ